MGSSKTVRNGEIECWRMFFCLAVFIFHVNLDHDFTFADKLFIRGDSGVEFFFILSGLLLARSADLKRGNLTESIGKTSLKYVLSKYVDILPYHVVAFGAGLWVWFQKNEYVTETLIERILEVIPQFLLIHLNGYIVVSKVVSVEWYISAMLIAMLILYPLLLKWYDEVVYVVAPLAGLTLMGYSYHMWGSPVETYEFIGITTWGVGRAVMSMCFGCIAYELSKKLASMKPDRGKRIGLTLACLVGYGISWYFLHSMMGWHIFYVMILIWTVTLAVSFSRCSLYSAWLDYPISRFFGRLSLPFYLNTNIIRNIMVQNELNRLGYYQYLAVCVGLNLVLSVTEMLLFDLGKKLINIWKGRLMK